MRHFLIFLALIQWSWACQICLPYPGESLLDQINAAERVVLARENPKKPFSLSAIKSVRGELGEVELDLYLPSATRRMLAAYGERSLLCVEKDGAWTQAAVYDPTMDRVLTKMLANTWGEDEAQRAHYFAQHLGHDNETIQRLAHLEVARAPYAQIRGLDHGLTREDLVAFLRNQRMMEWHSLYILLFAQVADEAGKDRIERRYRANADYHLKAQLAAWALAYLETGGEQAMRDLREDYFETNDRSDEELTEVVGALSAFGSVGNKQAVLACYEMLLQSRPELLGLVIEDLVEWSDHSSYEVVRTSLERAPELSIDVVRLARSFLSETQEVAGETSPARFSLWYLLIPFAVLFGLAMGKGKRASEL